MCLCVGVRPYRCDQCDKAFTQRCSLESHTRKVHGVELQFAYKQRRPKTYVCEECGHTTSQPELHYLHLRRLHPFSPALARSHDKRLFKFAAESPLLPSTDWKQTNNPQLDVAPTTFATFHVSSDVDVGKRSFNSKVNCPDTGHTLDRLLDLDH